ncbi:MAG: response regulator transcription factor [Verrucomicrobiaceae bacterium]|nr:MAG: response regulator transcription factor [Verrucomicrobiaceae bacterium]
MPTILVIEDDAPIRTGLVDALDSAGYDTVSASDGRAGMESAQRASFDLLLLDLVLPHVDGLTILKKVRELRPTTPVIILSAMGAEADRVRGLNLGADDYMVKPFGARELLARVNAVLRRSPERPQEILSVPFPGGEADLARCEVRHDDGKREPLSEREIAVLRYLAAHPGRAISREEILLRVWRLPASASATRTIDMHVANLRSKLRDDPTDPRVILTVRGKGYMLGNGHSGGAAPAKTRAENSSPSSSSE